MTGRLEGRHVVITGAAGGIGAACARRLVADGAHVLLADLEPERVEALGQALGQPWIAADVTRSGDITRMIDLAYQRWGRLDVLFNNAGIASARPLLELSEADWDRTLA